MNERSRLSYKIYVNNKNHEKNRERERLGRQTRETETRKTVNKGPRSPINYCNLKCSRFFSHLLWCSSESYELEVFSIRLNDGLRFSCQKHRLHWLTYNFIFHFLYLKISKISSVLEQKSYHKSILPFKELSFDIFGSERSDQAGLGGRRPGGRRPPSSHTRGNPHH